MTVVRQMSFPMRENCFVEGLLIVPDWPRLANLAPGQTPSRPPPSPLLLGQALRDPVVDVESVAGSGLRLFAGRPVASSWGSGPAPGPGQLAPWSGPLLRTGSALLRDVGEAVGL